MKRETPTALTLEVAIAGRSLDRDGGRVQMSSFDLSVAFSLIIVSIYTEALRLQLRPLSFDPGTYFDDVIPGTLRTTNNKKSGEKRDHAPYQFNRYPPVWYLVLQNGRRSAAICIPGSLGDFLPRRFQPQPRPSNNRA